MYPLPKPNEADNVQPIWVFSSELPGTLDVSQAYGLDRKDPSYTLAKQQSPI